MTTCPYQERLAEFALGCLDEAEHDDVLQHARQCAICRPEAEDYLAVLQRLALPDELEEPSALLGARLGREIRSELPPAVAATSPAGRAWLRHWPSLVAAVAAVLAVGWGFTMQSQLSAQQASLAQLSRRYDTIVDVLAAPNMQMREMNYPADMFGTTGRIYIDKDSGNGMIMHALPALREGEAYQLWFNSAGQRISGGVLRTNPDGSGYTIIRTPGPPTSFESVIITREPAGGSQQPTTDRLLWTAI